MKSAFVLLCLAAIAVTIGAQFEGGPEPPPPPFLQNAPEAIVNDFKKLLQNSGQQTDKEVDDAIEAWVGKQSAQIKQQYSAFKEQMKEMHEKAKAAHEAAVAKFSPEAKSADESIIKITTNPALTNEQKQAQVTKIMDSLPPKVRDEIMSAMRGQ